MSMLIHAHSGIRYLIILLIALTIAYGLYLIFTKKAYDSVFKKLTTLTMSITHIQFIIGIVVYFMSPKVMLSDMSVAMKNPSIRFFTVEHAFMMVIAIVLLTIGHVRSKRSQKITPALSLFVFAFILILAAIPGFLRA